MLFNLVRLLMGCRDCWLHISSFIYFISILICIIEKVYLDPTKCHCLLTWQSWYWFEQKLYDKSWPWCSRIIIMKTRTHPGIAHLGLETQTCERCLVRLLISTIPHSFHINPGTWTSCLHLTIHLSSGRIGHINILQLSSWVLVLAGLVWYRLTCVMHMRQRLKIEKWKCTGVWFLCDLKLGSCSAKDGVFVINARLAKILKIQQRKKLIEATPLSNILIYH